MNIKKISQILFTVGITFFIVILVNAWTGPTEAPPGGNVDAPLNTSNETQVKYGYLYFPKWFDGDSGYYIDPDDNSWLNRLYSHDIRSSIYYDLDDTDYYIDPSEITEINNLEASGTICDSNGCIGSGEEKKEEQELVTVITDDCRIVEENSGGEMEVVSCDSDEVAMGGGAWRNSWGTWIGSVPTGSSKCGEESQNGWCSRIEGGGDRVVTSLKCCKTKTISSGSSGLDGWSVGGVEVGNYFCVQGGVDASGKRIDSVSMNDGRLCGENKACLDGACVDGFYAEGFGCASCPNGTMNLGAGTRGYEAYNFWGCAPPSGYSVSDCEWYQGPYCSPGACTSSTGDNYTWYMACYD